MTGFDSKRRAAQDKLDDDADTLLIVYQRGFADGKKAAQPEQEPVKLNEPVISAWSLREVYFDEDGEPSMHRSPPAAEPPAEWELIKNILAEYGLDAIAFVAEWKAAQRPWLGLTDEDRFEFAAAQHGWEDLLIAAEAKLKETNNV